MVWYPTILSPTVCRFHRIFAVSLTMQCHFVHFFLCDKIPFSFECLKSLGILKSWTFHSWTNSLRELGGENFRNLVGCWLPGRRQYLPDDNSRTLRKEGMQVRMNKVSNKVLSVILSKRCRWPSEEEIVLPKSSFHALDTLLSLQVRAEQRFQCGRERIGRQPDLIRL